MNYQEYFKNKKITVMGLGLLGRGLGYTKFLAECGAILTVTDLKTERQLATSLRELKKYKNIKFVLGKHRLEDFRNKDMIIKAAGVPLDSPYIAEARKNKIPIEMDVSLFAKLIPEVMIIGITGTRGKSMTTALIYEILSKNLKKQQVFLGGNVRGVATLPLLNKITSENVFSKVLGSAKASTRLSQKHFRSAILICELDSWQLQGFGEARISPHISVFTSFMPDHMNYYHDNMQKYFADKANIFKYQNKDDFLIIRPHVKKLIDKKVKSKIIIAEAKSLANYQFIVPGEHQRENLACAVEVAKLFKIPEINIRKTVRNFKGVEGRLQYVKSVRGIKIYNDNNATTPEATIADIKALCQEGKEEKIILISGGADKKLDLKLYTNVVNTFCKAVVFIPGTGTDKLLSSEKFKVESCKVKNLGEAVKKALKLAKAGDIILFSPAFASFGMFNNEYERNDLFMKIIKKLK